MKKIPTLFIRDENDRKHVTSEVDPDSKWVLDGEGIATRKYDGTCVMLDEDGHWWARREVKPGKTPPEEFVPIETDDTTGKTVGWEPVERSGFARWHAAALGEPCEPGTYELIGPKVNGNPEKAEGHELIRHVDAEILDAPRDFESLRAWLLGHDYEGIVWHHTDARMAKLKKRDFAL
jgi:hypothetical protein